MWSDSIIFDPCEHLLNNRVPESFSLNVKLTKLCWNFVYLHSIIHWTTDQNWSYICWCWPLRTCNSDHYFQCSWTLIFHVGKIKTVIAPYFIYLIEPTFQEELGDWQYWSVSPNQRSSWCNTWWNLKLLQFISRYQKRLISTVNPSWCLYKL
jgi:hypothetical protein